MKTTNRAALRSTRPTTSAPTLDEVAMKVGGAISAHRSNPMKPRVETAHEIRELLRREFPEWSKP